MAQSKLRAWGSLTCGGKFLTRRRGSGNHWGGSALEPGSLCAGVLIQFQLGPARPVRTGSHSTAVGKVGLPLCAWSNTFVLFSGHFSMCSVTATANCSPSCWLCHGVRALLVRRGLSLLRWRGACSHGAVGWCWCQRKRKEAVHGEKSFQVQ